MPPQTIITEKRSRIMVGMGHHAILSLTPISLPKKFCRIFGHIFPKFSRMPTIVYLFSSNGTSQHPYFTPQKIYVAFSDTFSPNSLASQPTKCRGYPWQAGCHPAPDLW